MDESIPTAPSSFLSIAELIGEMQSRGETPSREQSWSYRCNGFLFDTTDVGNSGYDFVLSSSKRLSHSPPTVKVNTQKVVPWPEDVRDGDLVQVVANLQSSKQGEMGLSAISVVRIHDMETEHDLNVLLSSHKQIMQFIKRPVSSAVSESLTPSTMLTSKKASSSSSSSSIYAAPPPLPLLREPNQQTVATLSQQQQQQQQQQQPLSPIDLNSLFDDDDDDDHFKLISGSDELSSTATTSPCASGRDDSTPAAPHNQPTNDSFSPPPLRPPPPPPPQRLPSKPAQVSALASKNAGKFSRGGASKHKRFSTSKEQQ